MIDCNCKEFQAVERAVSDALVFHLGEASSLRAMSFKQQYAAFDELATHHEIMARVLQAGWTRVLEELGIVAGRTN